MDWVHLGSDVAADRDGVAAEVQKDSTVYPCRSIKDWGLVEICKRGRD